MDPTTIAQTLAAYTQQPARPYSPTPNDIADALYGDGPPAPLPSWLPQNVQNYINTQPSYGEGGVQAPQPYNRVYEADTQDAPSQPLNPQPDDIQRLFRNSITRNAPTGDERGIRDQQFRALMKLPGFSGFTGGDEI
jgi:hypothetical protein